MTSVRRRFFLTLAILIVTIIAVVLLVVTRPEANVEMKQPGITHVVVTEVIQRDLQPMIEFTGVLRPHQTASVRFKVSGELMLRNVEPGQLVDGGELLLQLDDADYQDVLKEATSQLSEIQAALERDQALLKLARENRQLAEREYQRLEKLGKGSLASVSTREGSRRQLINLQSEEVRLAYSMQSSRARLARQDAALSRAQRNLDRTRLLAPFTGRVNRVMAEVGEYLQGNSLVLELIDTNTLELEVAVTGDVAGALTLGQVLVLDIDRRQITGELVALQFDPDPQTHTHPLRIRIPGDGLLPGQLGRVGLPLRPRMDALIVPASAVMREEGKHYVFLLREGRLVQQQVMTGIRQDDLQILQRGVEAGDLVVARDVEVLSHDIEVQVESNEEAH
ncbi:MAG: efflux RND transporter periplasmic adaptor subunit [Candidatus Thiodiazotropha sp. (ex Lucinoma aequizonata)]|nr:efflux RND transporter periplasmic adaptor subunit [Candidatus Thiodiazotropha sp. (ex Lucinoma aequizonata)]MCU7887951.1 efflux RND transporter periplasmic adaptor subunit [Candidatus Thiodiazotropha sp. (ex Lucinoma aequizonata)]MCU7894576.1 efflux RND transporter periplasmic adaptor subunit [Candidatus Thiodiazotropha sp. (ex Lucinoma aequizonata)]MCU7899835.1 efflux RND transporter periplasmic adaptor subunit [Candidatus Thiodiazotropha sp. (ex Lucinoma aequizonata)]MCU7901164.1 efflux R